MPRTEPTTNPGQRADQRNLTQLTARYWAAFQAGNDDLCSYLEPQVLRAQRAVKAWEL